MVSSGGGKYQKELFPTRRMLHDVITLVPLGKNIYESQKNTTRFSHIFPLVGNFDIDVGDAGGGGTI